MRFYNGVKEWRDCATMHVVRLRAACPPSCFIRASDCTLYWVSTMSLRYARLTLQSCARSRAFVQGNKRPFPDYGRASCSSATSLLLQPLSTVPPPILTFARSRVFSSASGQSDGGRDSGNAEGLDELQGARTKAKEPSFPWRGAPKLAVQPESFLTKMVQGLIFDGSGLVGEDLRMGAEAAFVSAAAAFFKMRPSEVLVPEPPSTGKQDGASRADPKEAIPSTETSSAEGADSAKLAEEESDRVLEAINDRLVAFAGEEGEAVRASGAVPHFRLHQVVAAAVSKKTLIVGAQRGDDVSDRLKRTITPSWVVIVDMDNTSAEFERAMAGHMCVVLQVDVDLACDETFYVTDGENGKVIQGTKDKVGRIHRLRLESNIGTPENLQPPRWKVIDLDNWLEGNSFW